MPRWVVNEKDNEEESSEEETSEEEEDEDEGEMHGRTLNEDQNGAGPSRQQDALEPSPKRQKISLHLGKGKLVCHVSLLYIMAFFFELSKS